jgi:tRNA (adenine37-N6)-methyltransferase
MSDIRPIGFVRGGRTEPRDDHWGGIEADVVLDDKQFSAESTAGLDDFSHLTAIMKAYW